MPYNKFQVIENIKHYLRDQPIKDRPGFKPGGIVEPGVTHYATKTSGTGTGISAIDDPTVIKKAEDILTNLVERKDGYNVLDWKGGTTGKYNEEDLHKLLNKKGFPIKNRDTLNEIINKIANKNGWLNAITYKTTLIVKEFMNQYARHGQFTGEEKVADSLIKFRSKDPNHIYETINKLFKKWKDGKIKIPGYVVDELPDEVKQALDDWSPGLKSIRSIDKTKQLKFLDNLNNKNPSLTYEEVKALFEKQFPDARPKAFQHRIDQLYQLKVEGKIPSGTKTTLTHDVSKGDRSNWLKDGKTRNKAGNYNKILIAADQLDAQGNSKLATRFRNAAIKYFSPNTGILSKMGGEAEHLWTRTYGELGQLKIDSLVQGDLNTFKQLNFNDPIERLIKEYPNASKARKLEIKSLIKNRQSFLNELTGGMTRGIEFKFDEKKITPKNLTKPIDLLTQEELAKLGPRGEAYRKELIRVGKDWGLIDEATGRIRPKKILDDEIAKFIKQNPALAKQAAIALSNGAPIEKIMQTSAMKKALPFLKGEGYFVLAEVLNNWSKGQSFYKGLGKAIEASTWNLIDFDTDEKAVLNHAIEKGLPENEIKAMMDWLNVKKEEKRLTSLKKRLAFSERYGYAEQGSAFEISDELKSQIKDSEQNVEKLYNEYFAGKNRDPDMGLLTLQNMMESLTAEEWNKTAGTLGLDRGYREMIGAKGDEGVIWGPLIGTGWRELGEAFGGEETDSFKEYTPQELMIEHPVYGYKEQIKSMEEGGKDFYGVERAPASPMEDIRTHFSYALQPYAGGGITTLDPLKPWALPPEAGPDPYGQKRKEGIVSLT